MSDKFHLIKQILSILKNEINSHIFVKNNSAVMCGYRYPKSVHILKLIKMEKSNFTFINENRVRFTDGTEVCVYFKVITPSEASKMWSRHLEIKENSDGTGQRNTGADAIANLVRDMAKGKWKLNGATIVLADDGFIIDGQHRIKAISDAEIPQLCIIVEGIKPDVMDTIDAGRKRSTEHYLQIYGKAYESQSANVVKAKLNLDNNQLSLGQCNVRAKITNTMIVEEFESKKYAYAEATKFAKLISKGSNRVLKVGEVGGIYMHLIETLGYEKTYVEDFFKKLMNPDLTATSIFSTTVKNLSKDTCQNIERIMHYINCFNTWYNHPENINLTSKGDTEFIKVSQRRLRLAY